MKIIDILKTKILIIFLMVSMCIAPGIARADCHAKTLNQIRKDHEQSRVNFALAFANNDNNKIKKSFVDLTQNHSKLIACSNGQPLTASENVFQVINKDDGKSVLQISGKVVLYMLRQSAGLLSDEML